MCFKHLYGTLTVTATLFLSFLPHVLAACQCFLSCLPLSGCDWQAGYIHAISPSARSYSLLEPSSAGQINLRCQQEGALRGPISRWLGRGWEGWGVTAMGPSQAWLVSISGQLPGQLGAEPQWALINASHSEAWTVTTHKQTEAAMCTHTSNADTLCTHRGERHTHTARHGKQNEQSRPQQINRKSHHEKQRKIVRVV